MGERFAQVEQLSKLAHQYKERCRENPTENWADLLKAHTLYNACAQRTPDQAKWTRFAFELQQMYWDGRVSTTMRDQHKLTKDIKSDLDSVRKYSRKDTDEANSIINLWNCKPEELNCDYNQNITRSFCDMIKGQATKTNIRMKVLTGKIIQHCIKMINCPQPCKFSAVALGSLAKGEATPYSDLEFMFLVEKKTDELIKYFELLAMSVYFVIGNLQETPLKYMNIEELKYFQDNGMNGFKIDGLQQKAGNIPTGNGTKEQKNKFILTVDELVKQYRAVLDNPHPKQSLKGDFTAMLAHTTCLCGDPSLLAEFELQRREIPVNASRRRINLKMLKQDIRDYDFLPEVDLLQTYYQTNVKSSIYRFPSILAYNLKIFYSIESKTSWETLDILLQKGLLSKTIHRSLCLLLASAMYIRTAAYTYHDSQNNYMTFLPALYNCEDDSKTVLWHMPGPLVLHMSLCMIPVKQYLLKDGVENVLETLQSDIVMYDTQRDAASINFYNMNYREVIKIFENLEWKSLSELARLAHSFMFFRQWEAFQKAVHFIISHLEPIEHINVIRFEIMFWMYKSATGYTQQKSMGKAKRAFEHILYVLPDDFYGYLNQMIFLHAGMFHGATKNMDKADEYFDMSWDHYEKYYQSHPLKSDNRLINERKHFEAAFYHIKGTVLADAYQYEKAEELLLRSLDIKLELLGKNSVHPDIGLRYHDLGNVYVGIGQHQKGIEHLEKAMEHFKDSPHYVYQSMAIGFEKHGRFKDSVKYYQTALETASKAYPSCHPVLADYKRRIACAYLHQQNLNEAKKHLDEALTMYQTIGTSDDNLHYELARCHADFGQLFYIKREISAAVDHLQKALQYDVVESNFAHRDTAYHCYYLFAKIREEELNFPAAIELLTAGMKILPEKTDHNESRIASDKQLLENWKRKLDRAIGSAALK